MDDLARRQAELTAKYRAAARAFYEAVQQVITRRSYEQDRARIVELLDRAAAAAAALAPLDAIQRQQSDERMAAARAPAAAEQAEQRRRQAEVKAAARARDRAERVALAEREGPL